MPNPPDPQAMAEQLSTQIFRDLSTLSDATASEKIRYLIDQLDAYGLQRERSGMERAAEIAKSHEHFLRKMFSKSFTDLECDCGFLIETSIRQAAEHPGERNGDYGTTSETKT